MDRTAVSELVNRFYASRMANDVEEVAALFSDTAHIELAGDADDPSLNRAEQSPSGINAFLNVLVGTWTWHGIDMQSLLIDEDKVATRYRLDVTHVPSGQRLSTHVSDHIEITDGVISSFVEFVDTGLVERLSAGTAG
ncbi:MAG: nuclear transport factor 2 family protein [Pseudomonadota bacterium]